MTGIREGTRLSALLSRFIFQGYGLGDGVEKGLQNKIIINPANCVLRLTSLSGHISILFHRVESHQD